jgi:predicted transcriptional regulator
LSLKNRRLLNKNRCSLDIAWEMLSIVSVKMRKTRIMYGANLSFVQLEKYLAALLGSGLLECDGDSGYLITARGKEFLELYEDYVERSTHLKEEVDRNLKDRLRLENMCFRDKNPANQTGIGKDDA